MKLFPSWRIPVAFLSGAIPLVLLVASNDITVRALIFLGGLVGLLFAMCLAQDDGAKRNRKD